MISQVAACLLFCLAALTQQTMIKTQGVGRPPTIVDQSSREMSYKVSEKVELVCVASGYPLPSYRWTKNDEPLVVNGLGVQQVVGRGTLILTDDEPTGQHNGVYQCFASNQYGTAVGDRIHLRRAMLDPFPTLREATVHHQAVGSSLSLRCSVPECYPPGTVYWGENRNGPKLRPIETTERIALDYEGGLHFANVEMEDERGGLRYVCVVHNAVLRNLVQGDDQIIRPHFVRDVPKYERPAVMWSSPTRDIAIQGQRKTMKCIFSGYPTPRVTWSRLDTPMPGKNSNASFGQELVIDVAEFSDSGRYQCTAVNTASGRPSGVVDFALTVKSPPMWRNKQKPQNADAVEDDDVVFECNVVGRPKPTVSWTYNALSLDQVSRWRRRAIVSDGGSTLRLLKVTESDVGIFQCNASNDHGYIFANVHLTVEAESPSFVELPEERLTVAEGQSAMFTCNVYGAPKPTLIWQKGEALTDVSELYNRRISVLPNGNLKIEQVVADDAETYHCYALNKFGHNSASGQLVVLNRTRIVSAPPAVVVASSTDDVTLACDATTDARRSSHLLVTWYRDELSVSEEGRVRVTDKGSRLVIEISAVSDSGIYRCTASNGIDEDSAIAILTVKAKPGLPTNVRISSCVSGMAEITWSAARDNNDPISAYVVYYNSSHDDVRRQGARVDGRSTSARVRSLIPWTEYRFGVTAVNSAGEGGMAGVSGGEVCRTPPDTPQRSPLHVCTDSRQRHQLVIVWEPMLPVEHNGDGFHYIVSYKRLEPNTLRRASEVVTRVTDWRQSQFVDDDVGTYAEYLVTVQAANSVGEAPQSSVERRIGHSGEDVPLAVVESVSYDVNSINATHAQLTWNAIDTDVHSVRGFFRGYQIEFWKTDHPKEKHTSDVIIRRWRPCRPVDSESETVDVATEAETVAKPSDVTTEGEAQREKVTGTASHLWPYASITAVVRVINGAHRGPPSLPVVFNTSEGVPEMVPMFWVSERGSHHLKLSWMSPFEINGVLTGYVISYRDATRGVHSDVFETVIGDPERTYKKIFDLKDDTEYEITIWALTAAGKGQPKVIVEVTVPSSEPDRPGIENIEMGYDFVNVSWRSSAEEPSINPASEFVVEYQLQHEDGDADSEVYWQQTTVEREHNWYNVSRLLHGRTYWLRVAAVDRHGDMMKSDYVEVVVGIHPASLRARLVATGVGVSLTCLLLLLLVICLVTWTLHRRHRSGRYSVHEKEKLHGASAGVNLYDEPPFGEYVRTDDYKKRSMDDSSSKSESDSLGIYEHVDPIKFTDDGSFAEHVGAYRKIVDDEPLEADVTATSALSSLV